MVCQLVALPGFISPKWIAVCCYDIVESNAYENTLIDKHTTYLNRVFAISI